MRALRRGASLLALLLTGPANAHGSVLPIRTYTIADGLPRNRIHRIVKDSRGFLWFCTSEGLSRFDGYTFTNYGTVQGLPHSAVNDLLETRAGTYWVATGDGLARFTPRGGQLTFFHVALADDKARRVTALLEDRSGTVWIGTFGGLYKLDSTGGTDRARFVDLQMPHASWDDTIVTALLEDSGGAIWIGSGSSGLYRMGADGAVDRFTTREGLPGMEITALAQDAERRLYVSLHATPKSIDGGLCRLVSSPRQGQSIAARCYATESGLPDNRVQSLFASRSRGFWIGTFRGLSRMTDDDSGAQSLETYTVANGLVADSITAIADDGDGNLWLGTEASGAMKISSSGFTSFGAADGLEDSNVAAILEDRSGELCAVTLSSRRLLVHKFDGRRFIATAPRLPASVHYFGWGWNQLVVQDHAGDWWIPSGQGLWRFPAVRRIEELGATPVKAAYTQGHGLDGNDVFRVFEDSRGEVWLSTAAPTGNGLRRWSSAAAGFQPVVEVADELATAFAEERSTGDVWIGLNQGLSRYRHGRLQRFSPADGFPTTFVSVIHQDGEGRMWLATNGRGVMRVDSPGAEHPNFVSLTPKDGLSSDAILCLTEDSSGRLYFCTGRGIDRLDPASRRITHYTTADGLTRGELTTALRDRSGALWFGTSEGLSRLVPEPERRRPPPPVLLTRVDVAGVPFSVAELGESTLSLPTLQPSANHVQFGFVGIDFDPGESLRYQYILEGADGGWSAPTEQRTVNYASLPPGSYRFRVRAINSAGQLSDRVASASFVILPPLWRRWWFLTAVLCTLSTALYALYRYRLMQLVELERVRTRIATDLHDDVGASLSQIAILGEVIGKRVGIDSPEAVRTHSQKIAGISRELVDSMSDIVWAINPEKGRLVDLTQRMRQFAGEMFIPRDIAFAFDAPDGHDAMRMRPDLRRQTFLIFKELTHNVVRHSQCQHVRIMFAVDRRTLELTVADDGRGFEMRETDGHGLNQMRRRARMLGGSVAVTSAPGQGATITVRLPLAPPSRVGLPA